KLFGKKGKVAKRVWELTLRGGVPRADWPPGIPLEYTLTSYISAFEQLGYEKCDDGKYVTGFEKVAIYLDRHGAPSHAASQRGAKMWTSKLGGGEDIDHATLDGLAGSRYGTVAQFLRRRVERQDSILRMLAVGQRLLRRFWTASLFFSALTSSDQMSQEVGSKKDEVGQHFSRPPHFIPYSRSS